MKKVLFVTGIIVLLTLLYGNDIKEAILENGTKIIVYPDKTWLYKSEVNSLKKTVSDTLKILTDIGTYDNVYIETKYGNTIEDFSTKGIEIIDFTNGYFKIKSLNGRIGYVREYSIDDHSVYKEKIFERTISKANNEDKKLLIKKINIKEINSARGVNFSIEWFHTAPKNTIKYIYFTVVPYNRVGDIQTCEISGHSSFTGKVTGPIDIKSPFQQSYWSTAWYNNTIYCIKLTKVKVEYIDGSYYIYIKELPKIIDNDFINSCD